MGFRAELWLANGVKEKNCSTMDPEGKQYARTVREYADGVLFIGRPDPLGPRRIPDRGGRIDEFEIVNERSPNAAVDPEGG